MKNLALLSLFVVLFLAACSGGKKPNDKQHSQPNIDKKEVRKEVQKDAKNVEKDIKKKEKEMSDRK